MAEVVAHQLLKRFGAVTAVNAIDLSIGDGEFVFLLGPSGCGKTTTLRMIAGLEMPTSGKITIGGRNVTFLRARYRNVGMVFQDYGLYRHMTVFGNIAYPLKVRRMSRAEIRRRVGEVAATLRIADILDQRPDDLAGGQLQRVAIARMLVRDADVFLMDEPMSHLDAQLRGHMRAELRHLQKQLGVTTVFVTHDQLEAMTMADRIIVMRSGNLHQYGTPQEVFERPDDQFVATFVGEPQMNILSCTIEEDGGEPAACGPGFRAPLDRAWLGQCQRAARNHPLRLGIRPEHVSLRETPDDEHTIPAELIAFEATGTENLFIVKCGEAEITACMPRHASARFARSEGSRYFLRFDPAWLYLFDGESGWTLAHAVGSRSASVREPRA
ncbi:MAG TPA: ABC transporter ATP-binding protein [Bauldia sp.]|nr:ABC transporter ATP-binding protein [Bauldia sp.]